MALECDPPHHGNIGDHEPEPEPDPDRVYERQMEREIEKEMDAMKTYGCAKS